MTAAAAALAWVCVIVFGVVWMRRPPLAYRQNPRRGWWARENMAKGDAALGGCLIYSICILFASFCLFYGVFAAVAWLARAAF